jgi:hypothetical protein
MEARWPGPLNCTRVKPRVGVVQYPNCGDGHYRLKVTQKDTSSASPASTRNAPNILGTYSIIELDPARVPFGEGEAAF